MTKLSTIVGRGDIVECHIDRRVGICKPIRTDDIAVGTVAKQRVPTGCHHM